jgi:hypothetical protein
MAPAVRIAVATGRSYHQLHIILSHAIIAYLYNLKFRTLSRSARRAVLLAAAASDSQFQLLLLLLAHVA